MISRDETRQLLRSLIEAFRSPEVVDEMAIAGDDLEALLAVTMGVQARIFDAAGFTDVLTGQQALGAAVSLYYNDPEVALLHAELGALLETF